MWVCPGGRYDRGGGAYVLGGYPGKVGGYVHEGGCHAPTPSGTHHTYG